MKKLLVTGGAGFIGANFVHFIADRADFAVVNLDLLTYAGNPESLREVRADRHELVRGNIADTRLVRELLDTHQPEAIVHFAAESHVDRSIDNPSAFIETNVLGTQALLDASLEYWKSGHPEFRFLHVSTDEVYGDLEPDEPAFTELNPYKPSSPYAASKAAADHLVRAWHRTWGLPVLITNCSNNYGPRQFPEKLIPLMLINALEGRDLPVYGDGQQRRDWLYVGDHCRALLRVLEAGEPGRTYNVGGNAERTNIDIVHTLCDLLDERVPGEIPRRDLIRHVVDRPGHDRRYAIDASRIRDELGWPPEMDLAPGWKQQSTGTWTTV